MRTTTYSFLPPTSDDSTTATRFSVERTKVRAHAPRQFRTAIITGGNSGLGYECARSLLTDSSGGQPWHVIIACRDLHRADAAVERLRKEAAATGSAGQVEAMRLSLASLQSVRDFASDVAHRLEDRNLPPVHALICNAGVQSGNAQTLTVDGFESTFGVNHLGHFLS